MKIIITNNMYMNYYYYYYKLKICINYKKNYLN